MLTELHITNFALVDDQSIEFGPGLNVISGETGAGKSIVLQALDMILGGRARSQYLQPGTNGWEVQALFNLGDLPSELLAELPDIARSDELVVSRSFDSSGKGKVYINGKLGTLKLLEEICSKFMNICTQGSTVRLLDPRYHLQLLDDFAGHSDLVVEYQKIFAAWKRLSKQIAEIRQTRERSEQRREELELVVSELRRVEIEPGLRQRLEVEVKKHSSAESIIEQGRSLENLFQDDQSGILSALHQAEILLQQISRADQEQATKLEQLGSAIAELQELSYELSHYLQTVDIDEEQLQALRERLAEVARLERKYRATDIELCEMLERSEHELASLEDANYSSKLNSELEALEQKLSAAAKTLAASRRSSAKKLAKLITAELAHLNMVDSDFKVYFEQIDFDQTGTDRAEFQMITNKGASFAPIRQIASGGELSRIMLVLKKILRDRSSVNILVFDEIDSGISGGVARAVGGKLRELAESSQVLCITHLPQVASLAHHHFVVTKKSGAKTRSEICKLSEQERVEEIARMLAGFKVTDSARESARELLAVN